MLAAGTFALGTVPPGPGLDPDAQSYIGAAISLVASGNYRVPTSSWVAADTMAPLTHYPPGFPTLLAGPIAAGLSPLQSARLVIVAAAFITWVGLVLMIGDAAGTPVAVLGAFAALATPAIVMQYLSVLSEPPFLATLVLTLIGMVAMARAARANGSTAYVWALLVGLTVSVAVMLRYAGIALLAAVVLWSLAGRAASRNWSIRLRCTALVAAPTLCALGLWLLHTQRFGGEHSVRTIGFYPGFLATALDGLHTVGRWLVPIDIGQWDRVAATLVAAVCVWITADAGGRLTASDLSRIASDVGARDDAGGASGASGASDGASGDDREENGAGANAGTDGGRTNINDRAAVLLTAALYVGICYSVFLMASRLLADAFIPFDERLLTPLMLLAEVAVAVAAAVWWHGRSRWAQRIVVLVLSGWLLISAGATFKSILVAREDGNDFAGIDWRDSPTIGWVRAPTGGLHRVLYTNWPAALYFQADRASHDLPGGLDPLTLRRFRDRFSRAHGILVAFKAPSPDVASPELLAQSIGLHEVARFEDGSIWELPEDSAAVR